MSVSDISRVENATASWLELGEALGSSVRRVVGLCTSK